MGFFGISVQKLDQIQLAFLDLVSFYDLIYAMPDSERPPDNWIDNDEALDSWMEKRKFEMARKMAEQGQYTNPKNLNVGKTIGGKAK